MVKHQSASSLLSTKTRFSRLDDSSINPPVKPVNVMELSSDVNTPTLSDINVEFLKNTESSPLTNDEFLTVTFAFVTCFY